MAIVGVIISGVTSVNLTDAVTFIQSNLLMFKDDIVKALNIPGFIFYSNTFKNITLTGYSFTITSIDFSGKHYINTSGGSLEVPVFQSLDHITYLRLKASDYFPQSLINSSHILEMISIFVNQGQLKLINNLGIGDFNTTDFSSDFFQ